MDLRTVRLILATVAILILIGLLSYASKRMEALEPALVVQHTTLYK